MKITFSPLKAVRPALTMAFILCVSLAFGQENEILPAAKKYDHFIGLQVNPLFRQILNFGESDPVNNPYLLKYTLRNNKTGFAINFGGGLNLQSTETDEGLSTNDDAFDIRVGVGYQKRVAKKLEVGIGLDLIYGDSSRETFSVQVADFGSAIDSTITRVRNKSNRIGGGLQVSLNYWISERLLVGTESTLYYTRFRDRFNAELDNFFIPDPEFSTAPPTRTLSNVNEENTGRSLALVLPVAIYLSYKF